MIINGVCNLSPPDMDECSFSEFLCQHECVNQPGTYFCSCPAGYILLDDNRSCQGEATRGTQLGEVWDGAGSGGHLDVFAWGRWQGWGCEWVLVTPSVAGSGQDAWAGTFLPCNPILWLQKGQGHSCCWNALCRYMQMVLPSQAGLCGFSEEGSRPHQDPWWPARGLWASFLMLPGEQPGQPFSTNFLENGRRCRGSCILWLLHASKGRDPWLWRGWGLPKIGCSWCFPAHAHLLEQMVEAGSWATDSFSAPWTCLIPTPSKNSPHNSAKQ